MTPEQIASAIEDAFYEGFGAYETPCVPHSDVDFMWKHSDAKATADRILKAAQAQTSGMAGEVPRPILVTRTSENTVMLAFASGERADLYERAAIAASKGAKP